MKPPPPVTRTRSPADTPPPYTSVAGVISAGDGGRPSGHARQAPGARGRHAPARSSRRGGRHRRCARPDPRPILLKGPALAAWLYEDAFRRYGDVDLLVEEGRMGDAESVLSELGFGYGQPGWRELAHSWKRPDGKTVDLHRSLVGVAAPPARLWQELSGEVETPSRRRDRGGGAEAARAGAPRRAPRGTARGRGASQADRGPRSRARPRRRALLARGRPGWRSASRRPPRSRPGLRLTPSRRGARGQARSCRPTARPRSRSMLPPSASWSSGSSTWRRPDGLGARLRFLWRKLSPAPESCDATQRSRAAGRSDSSPPTSGGRSRCCRASPAPCSPGAVRAGMSDRRARYDGRRP